MKPLKLKFKGINSFSEETYIDFEKLTKNGIFGIFGDTGSGKSTILDCINFALYGDVDRSEEKTDVINYRCDSLEIEFIFEITDEGLRKTYIVERSLKKKSGVHKAMLYEVCGEENKCVADNPSTVKSKIISVLGLEAKDFRKCIALPQGEFAQFVKSQPAERIKLIERLFDLSKYGIKLKEKLSAKEKAIDERFNELNGKLSVYFDVSEEAVAAQSVLLNKCEECLKIYNEELKTASVESERIKELYQKKIELQKVEERFLELDRKKTEMEALRKSLNCLQGAETVLKYDAQIKEKTAELKQIDNQLKEIIDKKERALKDLKNNLEYEYSADFDNQISQSVVLSAKYTANSDKPKELNQKNKQLQSLRILYSQKEKELISVKQKKENYENCLAELQSKLKEVGVISLDNFAKNFKDEILKEEYQKQFNFIADLHSDIQNFEKNTELYKYVKKRFNEQMEYYKGRIEAIRLKGANSSDIQKDLKDLQTSFEKRDSLHKEINRYTSEISNLNSTMSVIKIDLERIKSDGEKLRSETKDLTSQLNLIFGENCIDYDAAIKSESERLKLLTEKKRLLSEKRKALEEFIKDSEIKISSLNSRIVGLNSEISYFTETLSSELKKINIQTVDDCCKLVEEFKKYPDAEKELANFDENYAEYKRALISLNKISGIESVTRESSQKAINLAEQVTLKVKECNAEYAVLNNNLKDLNRRLNEKVNVLNELKSVEHGKNLIYQLKEILKNNKFLEYIANEYLMEISSEASATLLKLTCGRYFLTYKDNFYVGDNYDCGNLRGVNTLSGGETFLVSLSLALALSSAICAKSLKSIEFFFLDEGFGTLDENLLDTVIEALEKLKSEQFTIGIISHVEELKHRIDSKIIVNKATENHGSTVQICC